MIHIRIFDARQNKIASFDLNASMDRADLILDSIGFVMSRSDDPAQAFKARVEDENGHGFWMILEPPEKLKEPLEN